MLDSINKEMGLYVLACGSGFTCLGFDVVHKRTARAAEWLGRPDLAPTRIKGTKAAFARYRRAYDAIRARHNATGERAPIELEPRLVGLEGRRVEVTSRDGRKRRFRVGRSMGWTPVHLEIARRDSTGGPAACILETDSVRVVS